MAHFLSILRPNVAGYSYRTNRSLDRIRAKRYIPEYHDGDRQLTCHRDRKSNLTVALSASSTPKVLAA
jgi:hypothetical protein